jgi:hypothetical protein
LNEAYFGGQVRQYSVVTFLFAMFQGSFAVVLEGVTRYFLPLTSGSFTQLTGFVLS